MPTNQEMSNTQTINLSSKLKCSHCGKENPTLILGEGELKTAPMTVDELCKEVHVTPQAIRKAITEGRLIATKLGNTWLISPIDARMFIERRFK